jgi:hypothetical protein
MPLWEGMLYWPYRVITFPLKLLGDGILTGVEWADKKHVLDIFFRPPGQIQLFPDITAGGLAGFGGGLALQVNDVGGPRNRLRFRIWGTVRGNQKYTAGGRFGIGQAGLLTLGAGYRNRANARYFGIGPETNRFDESFYGQQLTWVGAGYRHRLGNFLLRGKLLYTGVAAGEPGDDYSPSLSERFPDEVPPGFGERSDGVGVELLLGHSDVEVTGRPGRGGLRQLRALYFQDVSRDEDLAFWTFRAELQQFFRLWYEHHTLAVRWYASWIEPVRGTTEIPFQRLLINDDPDLLRGFNDFRWRDRGITVLSLEYRWPLWVFQRADGPGMDLYVLADVGQVFGELNEITWDNLTFSYGLGIRMIDTQHFKLRLEFARSNEQSMFRLKSEQIFQWTKGLFHGKDPVPPR